jgi:hypothetical protein
VKAALGAEKCKMKDNSKPWDVFISHTSKDKDLFVRPLAVALQSLGVSVWYDEFSLHLGDSLSKSIDKGLALSRLMAAERRTDG